MTACEAQTRRFQELRSSGRTLPGAAAQRPDALRSCGAAAGRSPVGKIGQPAPILDYDGAAQESNLPSRGLHGRTGFEGLPSEVQLGTGAAF